MAMSIRSTTTAVAPCSSSRPLQASSFGPSCLSTNRRDGRCHFLGNRSFLLSIMKVQNGTKIKMDVVVNGVEPGTPLPSDPSSGTSWKLWLVGMLFSVVIPFWTNKWWPLLKFKEQVGTAMDAVEGVAEIVEQVAGEVEKVADDIADHLPQGDLQKAARFVEKVAREAGKGAALADDLIEKVEDVEKELDSIIDQANEKIKASNDTEKETFNDTENETAKIKDATDIKNKITEIKEVNYIKKMRE